MKTNRRFFLFSIAGFFSFVSVIFLVPKRYFKKVLLNAKEEDIQLMGSPVGYPARGVRTNLTSLVEKREGPAIKCISNCVAPCNRGVEAKEVGFCIADRLSDAYNGNMELGLFFSGTNGYKLNELISVKELMNKLMDGE